MLSLGYPKLNFQVANESAEETLLHTVQDKLEGMHQDVSPKVFLSSIEQKEKAFQVNISVFVRIHKNSRRSDKIAVV